MLTIFKVLLFLVGFFVAFVLLVAGIEMIKSSRKHSRKALED